MNKIYLDVPFKEKDEAKKLGAKWDADEGRWYYTDSKDEEVFARWLDDDTFKKPCLTKFMTVEDLSDEQCEMIERAKRGENILVDACIGSGKTTAIQVLCNELFNKKILYLTYNALLKIDAREKIQQSNVMVTNYHGFAYTVLKQRGIKVGTSDLIQTYIREQPEYRKHFDLLVLDEYQDIEQEIAEMLEIIKKQNPNLQIIAVGDMKQKIYDKTTLDVPKFITRFLGKHTTLNFTKCFRLSKDLAARLGNIWEKEINGVNPNCSVEYMSIDKAVDFIATQNPADVLCLGARTGDLSRALNTLETDFAYKFNKHTVYASITDEDRNNVSPRADTAVFTTYDSSKGLERRYCVVFDFTENYWSMRNNYAMANYEILRNIFCVAASRGKEKVIFVLNDKDRLLEDKTLATPIATKTNFTKFSISEMFAFKYKEDIEACYNLLNIKEIHRDDKSVIDIPTSDELIDLSPCIGIYQEASYFKNYDIDLQLMFAEDFHSKLKGMLHIKKSDPVDKKILALAVYETGYMRYIKQVNHPLVTNEQHNALIERLNTVFSPDEIVQRDCKMSFQPVIDGKPMTSKGQDGIKRPVIVEVKGIVDVLKNDVIYELKFVNELEHEHFLQLASYLVAMNKKKGMLWNVRNNQMYEVTVPDRKTFFNKVVKTITKGAIKDFIYENPYCSNKCNTIKNVGHKDGLDYEKT